jgi:hypothetical protein
MSFASARYTKILVSHAIRRGDSRHSILVRDAEGWVLIAAPRDHQKNENVGVAWMVTRYVASRRSLRRRGRDHAESRCSKLLRSRAESDAERAKARQLARERY